MAPGPISVCHARTQSKDSLESDGSRPSDSLPSSSASPRNHSPPSLHSVDLADLPKAVSDAVLLGKATELDSKTEANLRMITTALRIISADAVEQARSGHPGMPLGMAPTAATLWDVHLRFSPGNPKWINRDRFVLSAGHGSILLYSLLHLYGYESIGLNELKTFRKRGSRAAGHPENILTPGVEVTTGALGQGIANAVGLAMAESHLAGVYNRPNAPSIIDHYTYCIVGDGCLMEGVASEACSLAGHWKLGKLIVFYDDNSISIEGSTDLAFTEKVPKRFRAYGWQVIEVPDGNTDIRGINEAILAAKAETRKPTLIKVTTTIGFGAPTKEGTNAAHGACLGAENIAALRSKSGWTSAPFEVPQPVMSHTRKAVDIGARHEENWNRDLDEYRTKHPELAAQFEKYILRGELPVGWAERLTEVGASYTTGLPEDARATRSLSHAAINCLASQLPHFLGGSADLGPSNLTQIVKEADYGAATRAGRNVHFGVREHAMGSITNGVALYGGAGVVPYCATFLVFSDYMRAAIRTAALSNAGTIFVMTHDSVLLGEDGPTHQPIEHLWSFRSMPNVMTMRPADGVEVAACYEMAVRRRGGPSMMVLSRQRFGVDGSGCRSGALRGGYVHSDGGGGGCGDGDGDGAPDAVVIATGSEVGVASLAARAARARSGRRVRVVSMPCVEQFEAQSEAYRAEVLGGGEGGRARERTLVVEAGATGGWWRYATRFVTIDGFGMSAPAADVEDAFGLTVDSVAARIEEMVGGGGCGAPGGLAAA